jgi:hypothetical protein
VGSTRLASCSASPAAYAATLTLGDDSKAPERAGSSALSAFGGVKNRAPIRQLAHLSVLLVPRSLGSVHICALGLGIACITPHRLQACNLLRGVEPFHLHTCAPVPVHVCNATRYNNRRLAHHCMQRVVTCHVCPIGLRTQPCEAYGQAGPGKRRPPHCRRHKPESREAIDMTEGIYRSVYRVGLGNDDDKVIRTNGPDLTNSSTSSDDVRRRYKV